MNAQTKEQILNWCGYGVIPVNANMTAAIAAHRRAQSFATLQAIITAAAPETADRQKQLDYLAGLPDAAWRYREDWPAYRERTIEAVRRSIAWGSICA